MRSYFSLADIDEDSLWKQQMSYFDEGESRNLLKDDDVEAAVDEDVKFSKVVEVRSSWNE